MCMCVRSADILHVINVDPMSEGRPLRSFICRVVGYLLTRYSCRRIYKPLCAPLYYTHILIACVAKIDFPYCFTPQIVFK